VELKHEKTAILVERVSEDKGRRTGTYNKFFAGLLQHVYRIPGACLQDFGSRSAGLLEHVCRTSGAILQDSWSMSEELLEQACRTPGACLQDFWSRSAGLLGQACRRRAAGPALEKSCRTCIGVGLGDCYKSMQACRNIVKLENG
jgi:hypothetical protein